MALNIIQVNDINLIASAGDSKDTISSAGTAILHEDGLKIGNEAEALAKIFPRRLNDSYWQIPSVDPLKDVPDYARHHADLIHYQLKAMHTEMGSPEEIVLAVPSNMDADQLSIVLGVAQPLPFEFVGLVDLAVASAAFSGLRGDVLYYDVQRHQTVITLLECGDYVHRKEHLIIPNHGKQSIRDKSASIIANTFIEQSRYDPMHAAQSEQALYNNLAQWLAALPAQNDLDIELKNNDNTYHAKLERSAFIQANDAFINTLITRGLEISNTASQHIGNQHIAPIQALSSKPNLISMLPAHATFRGILDNQESVVTRETNLPLVTQLKNSVVSQIEKNNIGAAFATATSSIAPTHLLVDNTATALPENGSTLNLHIVDNHLITSGNPDNALARIEHVGGKLNLLSHDHTLLVNNKTPTSSVGLESGDIISAQGGLSARLIIVSA